MKNMLYYLVIILMINWGISTNLSAQDDESTVYHVLDFMKVKPGMGGDYVKLEGIWKKIHEAKIKAGMLGGWALLSVASPAGDSYEYNFVTRNTYIGDDQLVGHFEGNFFPENWESLLTEEELELMQKTNALRTIVKEEVWVDLDRTLAEDLSDAKVVVFNYFKLHEGKTSADHRKLEQEIWKPVHDARVKDGKMKGWVLMGKALPMGSNQVYTDATVDIYTSIKDMMNSGLRGYFEKVHAGKDAGEMMSKIGTVVDRADVQIWMILDRTAPLD